MLGSSCAALVGNSYLHELNIVEVKVCPCSNFYHILCLYVYKSHILKISNCFSQGGCDCSTSRKAGTT